MKELYIIVLKFGVPINELMFYRRESIGRPWTVGIVDQGYTNVQYFLDLLREQDEEDIDM